MNPEDIAKVALTAGSNLLGLARDLIGASKEQSTAIHQRMVDELNMANSLLRAGGALDTSFAEADKKLDDKIANFGVVDKEPNQP